MRKTIFTRSHNFDISSTVFLIVSSVKGSQSLLRFIDTFLQESWFVMSIIFHVCHWYTVRSRSKPGVSTRGSTGTWFVGASSSVFLAFTSFVFDGSCFLIDEFYLYFFLMLRDFVTLRIIFSLNIQNFCWHCRRALAIQCFDSIPTRTLIYCFLII